MCRLWGVSYKDYEEDLTPSQIASILFPALVRQGPHAYGWAQWVPGDGVSWEKHPGRVDTDEGIKNIITGVSDDAYWVIGHTRWATTGDPKDSRNNHPIPHGDIVGIHNGVIGNYEEILAETGREDPKTEVDSEAIFAAVNRWGHRKGLRKLRGSLVAVYTNVTNPETFYIARTSGRYLTLGWTDRGNLIFASEKEALLQLEPDITFTKFSTVSENRIISISYGDITDRANIVPPQKKLSGVPVRASVTTIGPNGPDTRQAQDLAIWLESRGYGHNASVTAYLERRRDEREQRRLFPNGAPDKRKADSE